MTEVRKGLGRGLSALLGEPVSTTDAPRPTGPAWIPPAQPSHGAAAAMTPSATNVVELPTSHQASPIAAVADPQADIGPRAIAIAAISANPNQPRRYFSETDLTELADSIRARGVLQPILVRPAGEGRFEIVAGERRFRAAQRAGLTAIPAVVRAMDDAEVLEIAIIENVQRVDLNPIEEAMGYQALIDRFGRTQAELAEVVGKSRPHIANTLRLLSLPSEIQDMVREGRLTAGHARACISAPDSMGLARIAAEQGLSVREVERMAAKAKDELLGPRAAPLKAVSVPSPAPANDDTDSDLAAMQQSLSVALGLDVAILRKGEGAGEIRIVFKSLSDLDDVCRRLTAAQSAASF